MKERVGILYGKPIIVGDKNDQTVNEIYLSSKEISGNDSFSIPIIEYGKAENNIIPVITEIGTFEGRTGENNSVIDVLVNSSELLNYLKDKYSVYIKTAVDTVEHNASITVYNLVINSSYIRKDYMNGDIYEMEYTFFAGDFMLTFRIMK